MPVGNDAEDPFAGSMGETLRVVDAGDNGPSPILVVPGTLGPSVLGTSVTRTPSGAARRLSGGGGTAVGGGRTTSESETTYSEVTDIRRPGGAVFSVQPSSGSGSGGGSAQPSATTTTAKPNPAPTTTTTAKPASTTTTTAKPATTTTTQPDNGTKACQDAKTRLANDQAKYEKDKQNGASQATLDDDQRHIAEDQQKVNTACA